MLTSACVYVKVLCILEQYVCCAVRVSFFVLFCSTDKPTTRHMVNLTHTCKTTHYMWFNQQSKSQVHHTIEKWWYVRTLCISSASLVRTITG